MGMNCPTCGSRILKNNPRAIYCSDYCKNKYHKNKQKIAVHRTCFRCHKPFSTTNSKMIYCSSKCRLKEKSKKQRSDPKYKLFMKKYLKDYVKTYVRKKRKPDILPCPVCGKQFNRNKTIKKYCSKKCRDIRNYEIESRKLGRTHLHELPRRICLTCKHEFQPKAINQDYCKKKCFSKKMNICVECKKLKPIYGHNMCVMCYSRAYRINKNPPKTLNCLACGKKFNTRMSNKKYCSRRCFFQCYRKTINGVLKTFKDNQRRRKYQEADKFSLTKAKLINILERDVCCVYCGKPGKTLDHIVPISRKGKSSFNNLVLCCKSCNSSKSQKDVYVWLNSKGRKVPVVVSSLLQLQRSQRKLEC